MRTSNTRPTGGSGSAGRICGASTLRAATGSWRGQRTNSAAPSRRPSGISCASISTGSFLWTSRSSDPRVKIVVCIKEILDHDIPSTVFEVDTAANAVREGVALRYVISPFDAQAIELALRLRDKGGDCTISLVTLGGDSARGIIKYGLALGANDAFM